MYTVYLAGPITGLSHDDAVDWRDEVIRQLPVEIEGLSPLRGKTYLAGVESIAHSYPDLPLSSPRGIMTRDFNDVRRCDALLVNFLGTKTVSIGTVMEVAWAFAFRIPVIAVMEPSGNLHEHPMIAEAIGFRVASLDEAVDILEVLLMPAPHR